MSKNDFVTLQLDNGDTVYLKANFPPEEGLIERGSFLNAISFEEVSKAIRVFAQGMSNTFNNFADSVKPDQASVEFGVEIGIESGALTTFIVGAASKGSINIKLEWELKNKQEKK